MEFINAVASLCKEYESLALNAAYYEEDTPYLVEWDAADWLLTILHRQHADWCRRNAEECAVDALENRLLGYTR